MSVAESTVLDRELVCAAQRCPEPFGDVSGKVAATEISVTSADVQFMDDVVASVHRVVQTPLYQSVALERAPTIARATPQRIRGLFSGFDFHPTPQGPRLIEINTNAGGAFYGALIDEMRWRGGDNEAHPLGHWSHLFVQHVRKEWQLAGQGRRLRTIAVVDDAPDTQFLRFEFQLASRFLQEAGYVAFVADIRELTFEDGRLSRGGVPIDFVYNRLTSFALDRDIDRLLHDALLAGAVVVSPDPRTHALLACKRNLALLGDDAFLREAGVDPSAHGVLLRAIPRTSIVTAESADEFWRGRSAYYFKPVSGFGSRAVYDGDKLTAKTWQEMLTAGGYVAQARVEAPRTPVRGSPEMRFDVRTFAYGAQPFMRLARVYRGQTTNFRTPGGGFAPVRVKA
jgi:hypothetical protein